MHGKMRIGRRVAQVIRSDVNVVAAPAEFFAIFSMRIGVPRRAGNGQAATISTRLRFPVNWESSGTAAMVSA